jgi:hypothetical protein
MTSKQATTAANKRSLATIAANKRRFDDWLATTGDISSYLNGKLMIVVGMIVFVYLMNKFL